MRFSTKSIQFKIWRSQLITLLILLLLLILANFTVFELVRDRIVYEHLESVIEERNDFDDKSDSERHPESSSNEKILSDRGAWTPHFAIKSSDEGSLLIMDQLTDNTYLQDSRENVPLLIMEAIETDSSTKGKLSRDISNVYYMTHSIDDDTTMVFFQESLKNNFLRKEYLLVALFLAAIGFFTSAVVAKKLSKPINALDDFAEELSKRNWKAQVPESDTFEIKHLTNSLDAMKTSLQELEMKDRKFLQSTSHDLKTPVMIIKGYAQAMKDGVTIHSDQSIAEVLLTESQKLERRITQLLKLNTIGHTLEHEDQKDYIRIDRLLNRLIKRFEVIAPDLKWDISMESLEILGNPEALLIAFENLLENQLRYAASKISITCHSGEPNLITIGNDGPTFETDDTCCLFDPYKKETDGNFGLGLAIVKQVIEGHGGAVEAYNTDEGVTFKISL